MLVITTALVVLYALGTTRTVIGPQIYAVGGNAEARISPAFRHKTERLAFLTFIKSEEADTVTAVQHWKRRRKTTSISLVAGRR